MFYCFCLVIHCLLTQLSCRPHTHRPLRDPPCVLAPFFPFIFFCLQALLADSNKEVDACIVARREADDREFQKLDDSVSLILPTSFVSPSLLLPTLGASTDALPSVFVPVVRFGRGFSHAEGSFSLRSPHLPLFLRCRPCLQLLMRVFSKRCTKNKLVREKFRY